MFDKVYYIASILDKMGNSKIDEKSLSRLGSRVMFMYDPALNERAALKYMDRGSEYLLTSVVSAIRTTPDMSEVRITTENSIYVLREKKV